MSALETAYRITRPYSRTLGAEAEPMIAQDIATCLGGIETALRFVRAQLGTSRREKRIGGLLDAIIANLAEGK